MSDKQTVRRIRLIIKGLINSTLFKLVNRNHFKSNDAIIICGAMRSGSTWLAELLSAVEGHMQVFEPLHPHYVKEVNKAGLGNNRYFFIDKKSDNFPAQYFINSVLTGKYLNHWMLSQASFSDVINAKKLIVKFVRANLLIDWMNKVLDIRKPIVILRHPCGIIASTMKKKWIKDKNQVLGHPYLQQYPQILAKCKDLTSQEELSAILWCIQYHPLLKHNNGEYILVSYESLVRNGKDELIKIYAQWNEVPPIEAIQQLQQASDTSTKDSMINRGKDPLAGWTDFFSNEQIDRILNVLSYFDIQVYSKELEPDYNLINKYNN